MAKAATQDDTCYLVLTGAKRYISSYVENGNVVVEGQTISCGPAMRGRLISDMRTDTRTNEPAAYFRDATDEEAQAYIHRLDDVDPLTGDPSLVAEVARNEALAGGKVEKSEAKENDRAEAEEEKLQPKRRRRAKNSDAED